MDDLAMVLSNLRSSEFAPPTCLPTYWEAVEEVPSGFVQSDPYHLMAVHMPPELYDADESVESSSPEGQAGRLTFFGPEVSD